MPKLSIIMLVFNEEKRLDRAVNSVMAQTFEDWELILINDGSMDASAEICEAWAERDERISVIHQGNMGPGPARNAGVKKAKGDFVGFVDADDCLMPDMYRLLLDAAGQQGADVVKCGIKAVSEQDRPENPEELEQAAETEGSRRFATGPVDKIAQLKKLSTGSRDTSVCNLIVQKSIYKTTQFTNGFYEDAFYLVDILPKAKLFYAIPEVLYLWIRREDDLSHNRSEHREVDRAFYYQRLFRLCEKQEQQDLETEKQKLFNTIFAISERIKTDELKTFSRDMPKKLDILSKFLDRHRDYLDPDIMEIYDLIHEVGDEITEA